MSKPAIFERIKAVCNDLVVARRQKDEGATEAAYGELVEIAAELQQLPRVKTARIREIRHAFTISSGARQTAVRMDEIASICDELLERRDEAYRLNVGGGAA